MKTILIIDDENYINRLVHFNLLEDGYDVITSSSGREGLELMRKRCPDLVILDIAMPEMDGFTVMEKMKTDDRLREIPVLVLTAKVMEEVEQKAKKLGAVDFITKPFSPSDLSSRVREIIG
jgi:two-component system alkaline phosphatase synthesis response regulator PhoP